MVKYTVLNVKYICIGIFSHFWAMIVLDVFMARSATFSKGCWTMLSMKWPVCISSIPVLLHHSVRTHKTLGDKLSPLGTFYFISFAVFYFQYGINKKIQFDERKHIYIDIWLYHSVCRETILQSEYMVFCVLNINLPHGSWLRPKLARNLMFSNFLLKLR